MSDKDLTGLVFSRLTVLRKGPDGWLCRCECGNRVSVQGCKLTNGNNRSCGCLKRDALKARNTSHGLSDLPEYSVWKDMKKRCYNKNNKRYANYAAKGIVVCDEWLNDFEAFLNHIGKRPVDGQVWTVGRIDNNLSYQPGNVRWETLTQQSRNHSQQVNNTSGITGVRLNTKIINGKEYSSWTASYNDLNGKKKTKEFSTNKYGFDKAKELAITYRETAIRLLNAEGADYADSHGMEVPDV